jgi:NAD(P)-dependent dehydrogenase (short-subunit alcohol dehydrogenase family)
VENTLDTLILNAAVMPTSHKLYPIPGGEQFEQSFLTAVMGHALLVNELETALLNSSAKNDGEIPKIVLVSSDLHRKVKGLDGT